MIFEHYRVDGHRLEAARIKARLSQLPPVVMLHEGLGSVAHWKDFPAKLAEATGAEIFLYSRYGHGGSDRLEEPRDVSYMHHEAQVVLPEFLRHAQIERPVLFGQSDGASISIIYAGTFPDRKAFECHLSVLSNIHSRDERRFVASLVVSGRTTLSFEEWISTSGSKSYVSTPSSQPTRTVPQKMRGSILPTVRIIPPLLLRVGDHSSRRG